MPTEFLTQADMLEVIGWLVGGFGLGWCAGKIQLSFKQIGEKL
jgi:hypothetical protein